MRICLFGEGPLNAAVRSALQGHEVVGPFACTQPCADLTATQARVGLSAGYRHKLSPEERACFPDGMLNLHTSYLPWNRGAYPNVWPILDGSPAGVTLHWVDDGWDTGPIVAQKLVTAEPWDTAKTLYDKLRHTAFHLVAKEFAHAEQNGHWPEAVPQDPKAGSFHRKADLDKTALAVFAADGGEFLTDAIRMLRAASFPGYGLRYRQDGKLIEATITLKEVTE